MYITEQNLHSLWLYMQLQNALCIYEEHTCIIMNYLYSVCIHLYKYTYIFFCVAACIPSYTDVYIYMFHVMYCQYNYKYYLL